jgi:iron complex outermembrane recepter protein
MKPFASKTKPSGIRFVWVPVACLLLAAAGLPAQDAGDDSDIIELNPFEVNASAVQGYFASETTTGTRIASNIQELPIAVSVVTSEFLDEFQAYELQEQFAYVSSFVSDGEGAQYYLRGFRASYQLRNGFIRTGHFSKVTTNRAEVIKGPAASIYGRTQPGGVVNYVTKKATDRFTQSLRFSIGTDDHYRAALNASGPVIPGKLLYRFDTSFRHEEIPQGGPRTPFTEEFVVAGLLEWRISPNTRLTLELDRIERADGRPDQVPILYQDLSPTETRAGGKRHIGLAYDVVDLGLNNLPETEITRDSSAANLLFTHRFNSVWSLRLAGDYSERVYDDLEMYQFVPRVQVRDRQGNETFLLIAREPRNIISHEDYMSASADLLAEFLVGPTEHKLLLTADHYRSTQRIDDWRLHDNSNPLYNERNMEVHDPQFLWTSPALHDEGVDPTRPAGDPGGFLHYNSRRDRLKTAGGFASWRMASLEGRLITLLGVRREFTRYDRIYSIRPHSLNVDIPTYDTYATTKQGAFTYKVTPQHYFFFNYSESYDTNRAVDLQGNVLPNETASGVDIGVKSSLRDGKINYTFTVFSIDRKDVRFDIDQFDPNEERIRTASAAAGLVKGEGLELDFNLHLLDKDKLNIFGGYGYNDTEVREAGRDLDLVGRRWERVPLHMVKLGARYRFTDGPLQGLVVTGGVRYESGTVFQNGSAETLLGDDTNERSGNDGRREIMEPARTLVDMGLMYTIRASGSLRHIFQLNVKNVLDFDKPTNNGRIQSPRRVIFQYRIDW